VLTPRFLALALLAPILMLLGTWLPFLVPVAVLLAFGLALLLVYDWRAAGKVAQFRVHRHFEPKLSLGALNRVTLAVHSAAPHPVQLFIRDEPPLLFVGAETAYLEKTLQPGESAELSYQLRPLKRGDYSFGNLNLRWTSPLHFVIRQGILPAAAPVKVYPNLYEIRKFDLLARRDQLSEIGLHNVRLRGEGTAFESLRDYTPDDPYRIINWKATARRARPISMDFEPERSQRVMIVLDVGRMMRSPIRVHDPGGTTWDMSKVDCVINSVLLFSYVANLKGDQVGLLVFADQVLHYIAPHTGRAQFQKLLDTMYALESQPAEADYGRALNYLRAYSSKRSLMVLFTDLSGARASESLMKYLPRLRPHHLPMIVTIRDPALDHEAHQTPDTSEAVYRRAVAEQMILERRLLLDQLQHRGVLTLDVDAEHLTMAVVNRYLELKARHLT